MPTEQEISRAKEYLVLRLRAERLAVSTLDDALLSAARRIAGIARYYNVPPERFRFSANPSLQKEVDEVLELLREALYSRIEGIDTFEDEEEDSPFVAPALTEKVNGRTFRQRLADYVSRWGFEIEAVIAAAGLNGVRNQTEILDGIREYMDRPYENPWMKEHMGEGDAVRLNTIPHYGKGRHIASAAALALLLRTTVARGWMQNWARLNAGKRGYYVFRGSSYPCEICDAQVGFLHDASDMAGLPPQHPNCVCFTVYTDNV